MIPVTIRTGGQTGVDRAALAFAVRRGLHYCGWCPRGGWDETNPPPPGVRAVYPLLTETPSAVPEQRTAWNVRDSHATLILARGTELAASPGTKFTQLAAELLYLRPCLVVDLTRADAVRVAREWLERTVAGLGVAELVLNVAGPRERQAPGIEADAGRFLEELFA